MNFPKPLYLIVFLIVCIGIAIFIPHNKSITNDDVSQWEKTPITKGYYYLPEDENSSKHRYSFVVDSVVDNGGDFYILKIKSRNNKYKVSLFKPVTHVISDVLPINNSWITYEENPRINTKLHLSKKGYIATKIDFLPVYGGSGGIPFGGGF